MSERMYIADRIDLNKRENVHVISDPFGSFVNWHIVPPFLFHSIESLWVAFPSGDELLSLTRGFGHVVSDTWLESGENSKCPGIRSYCHTSALLHLHTVAFSRFRLPSTK